MPDSTYIEPILVTGDMLADLSSGPYQQGNSGDDNFGIVMPGAQAIGASSDLYRLVWHQNTNGADVEFRNGQGWRLESYDPVADADGDPQVGNDGWTTVPGYALMTPKPDLASDLGAGDDYIVFDAGGTHLLYDINGGLPTSPTTLTYLGTEEQGDPAAGDNDGQMDFQDSYEAVVCFVAGTRIATANGSRPVQHLAPGDRVQTRDNGLQTIRWVSGREISGARLACKPNLRPVRVKAGALGPGRPVDDLLVSPQHRVLLGSRVARRIVGSGEVLIPAIKLVNLPGITQVRARRGIRYHHFLLDRHELVYANGAWAESFFPGEEALRAIAPEACDRLMWLLPELSQSVPGMTLRTASPVVSGRAARDLVLQHKKAVRLQARPHFTA